MSQHDADFKPQDHQKTDIYLLYDCHHGLYFY